MCELSIMIIIGPRKIKKLMKCCTSLEECLSLVLLELESFDSQS